jgi:hypothetical protein
MKSLLISFGGRFYFNFPQALGWSSSKDRMRMGVLEIFDRAWYNVVVASYSCRWMPRFLRHQRQWLACHQ